MQDKERTRTDYAKNYKLVLRMVSPAEAKRNLETSERNRQINKARVQRYAEDMRAGKWSPATLLVFDEDGHMVDGHHRMLAVVEAGMAVPFCVLVGVERSAIPHIDTGRPRSAGDMLAFVEGLDGVTSLRNKSTIARIVVQANRQDFSLMVGYDAIADFMLENTDAVNEAYLHYTRMKPVGASLAVGAALFAIIKSLSGPNIMFETFCKQVETGEMLSVGMPAYALRKALLSNSKAKHGQGRHVADMYVTLKAWQSCVARTPLPSLRLPKSGDDRSMASIIFGLIEGLN